jgi:hypothetical protein
VTSVRIVVAALIALAACDRDRAPRERPGDAAAARVPAATPTIEVTVEGAPVAPLSAATLAGKPPSLLARGRHAWRLSELLGDAYTEPQRRVVARTADGRHHVLRGDGKVGDDVILVQRDDGSLYIGWLVDGAERFGAALGDAEQPASRLEEVVALTIAKPPPPAELPPARVEIERDGAVVRTVTADEFAALATTSLDSRGTVQQAIDLSRDLGGPARLAGLVAEGVPVDGAAPLPDARPVLYLNRRKRFKFAWVDSTGKPLLGTRVREVTRVILRTP